MVSRYVYVKVSCWILRVVGGGPNGVFTMAMHLTSLESWISKLVDGQNTNIMCKIFGIKNVNSGILLVRSESIGTLFS